jgi:hypothetical protein
LPEQELRIPKGTALRKYSLLKERIPLNLKRVLAFNCPECRSWLYFTRDLVEDRISLDTAKQYRKFVCADCGKIFEFEGFRGVSFPKKGAIQPTVKVRETLPPELVELLAFKKNIEKILRMKL